jgi:Nucleotidyltransferase
MDLTPLEWEQRRHLDEVRDLWRTLGPLLQQRHQFAGGVTWKQVKGYEYLARFQTDPVTHAKKFEYLGKRKPETERIYADFQRERADLDSHLAALQRRMDFAARVSKALRLGRMPTQAADALRAVWRAGLDKDVIVVGSANIYAYELLTGLLVPREAMPAEDLDLMLLARSEEAVDDLKRVLVTADRSYRFNNQSSEFIASDGFRIGLQARREVENGLAGAASEGIDREAVAWALGTSAVSGMVLGRDGQPTGASFLDPRAFLLLTACAVRTGLMQGPQAEARIEAVTEMVAREWTEPFPEQFVELSPVLEEAFGGPRSPRM